MPSTSMQNSHAKPSMRNERSRPRAGSHSISCRITLPWASCGKNHAAWTAQPSATNPASVDSRLRAFDGSRAASTLAMKGSATRNTRGIAIDSIDRPLHRTRSADEVLHRPEAQPRQQQRAAQMQSHGAECEAGTPADNHADDLGREAGEGGQRAQEPGDHDETPCGIDVGQRGESRDREADKIA